MSESLETDHPIILFDGVCNLCEGFVTAVIERDPDAQFRFAPLQSSVADSLLEPWDIDPDGLESVVLIDNGRLYRKSDAVIQVARRLGFPHSLLGPTRILPRILRDFVYDFVADRRYGWFGKKDQCMMPTPDIQSRFLAGAPGSTTDE